MLGGDDDSKEALGFWVAGSKLLCSRSWQAYMFHDYWEDIGTIRSFFDANLALAEQVGPPAHSQASSSVCLSGFLTYFTCAVREIPVLRSSDPFLHVAPVPPAHQDGQMQGTSGSTLVIC